jgi:hypothetical protein
LALINFKIPSSKAAAMSYILMLVSTGYRHWIRGEMHCSKALAFAARMNELYHFQATQSQRALLKKKGMAACQLVMLPHEKDKTKIMFWLLATPGKGLVHEREKLNDALTCPLTWGSQYHVTKIQRNRKQGGKISWTWQMQALYFKEQLSMTKEAADSGAPALENYFGKIKHMPMFSGIRDQVNELREYARKTWAKRRKSDFPSVLPDQLPSMTKIEVFGNVLLPDLVTLMLNAELERAEKARIEASSSEFNMPQSRL